MEGKRKDHQTLKELPLDERPREKLWRRGAENLSNTELLALILGSGNRQETALGLAQRILASIEGLRGLLDHSVEELMKINGIGLAKASQLKAVAELGRRIPQNSSEEISIRSPREVAGALMNRLRYLKQEHFDIVLLNTKNKVIAIESITVGSLNSSIVHPREVFNRAIRRCSAAIILAHNHPSGDPTPSQDDIRITRRLIEAGQVIGIQVLDHIIIGDGKYKSLKQEGFI